MGKSVIKLIYPQLSPPIILLVTPFCNYLHGKFLCNGNTGEGSRAPLNRAVSMGLSSVQGAWAPTGDGPGQAALKTGRINQDECLRSPRSKASAPGALPLLENSQFPPPREDSLVSGQGVDTDHHQAEAKASQKATVKTHPLTLDTGSETSTPILSPMLIVIENTNMINNMWHSRTIHCSGHFRCVF